MNEGFLRDTRKDLDDYFEHTCTMEPREAERDRLHAVRERALQSPLTDSYTLFMAFDALEQDHGWQAKSLLGQLTYREAEMGEREYVVYALARGRLAGDMEEKLAWHRKANRLRPCAFVAFQMGQSYHEHGKYQEAIDHLQIAYTRAADEGNPMVLLLSTNLTAISYSDLYQENLMLHYFQKARRLAHRIAPWMLTQIDYNIGATLVSMRKSEQALPYLRKAEAGKYDSPLLLYHKLAIACFDIGDGKTAAKYLRKADALIQAGKAVLMEEKLIRIVRFRLREDYLASPEYVALLREVYDEIGTVYHHGFKQFQGNLLVEALVHNRRYKEALRVAAEVDVFPSFLE